MVFEDELSARKMIFHRSSPGTHDVVRLAEREIRHIGATRDRTRSRKLMVASRFSPFSPPVCPAEGD